MKKIAGLLLILGLLCFNQTVMAAPNKLAVVAPATGSVCENLTVTVTAETSAGAVITNFASLINLSTSTGTGAWVSTTGQGTFSGGSGTATYTFVPADLGVVTFQLNYPPTGVTPAKVSASSTGLTTGTSANIAFETTALLVSTTNAVSMPAPFAAQIAGTPFTIFLIDSTPNNFCSGGAVKSTYTGAKTIRFYTTYINPAAGTASANTVSASIGTVLSPYNGTTIANSSGAAVTSKSITFTNGVATIYGNYNDVGILRLNVIDTAANGPSGVSGNFVIAPASFALNVPNNSASQTQTAAACLTDTAFTAKAGNPFTVNVQPLTTGGLVTPNYGLESPAQGITLISGAIYGPNSARNGSAGTGAIGNGSTFARVTTGSPPSGFSSTPSLLYLQGTTFTFDEVGCINLTANVSTGNYLGVASSATGTKVVGRFVPDHFMVSGNTPQFVTVGSGFTYLDQPFLFSGAAKPVITVTAQALANTTTENYTGSFWKLTSAGLIGTVYNQFYYPVVGGDTIPALTFTAPLTTPGLVDIGGGTVSAASGVGTFTYPNPAAGFTINRLVGSVSPAFTPAIQLYIPTIQDSDGVLCSGTGCVTCTAPGSSQVCTAATGGFAFGTTASGTYPTGGIGFSNGNTFYHGRLIVQDANGPETLPLTMPMQTQYYTTAGGFVLNTFDSGGSGGTVFTGGAASLILTPTPASGLLALPILAPPTTVVGTGSAPYNFTAGVLNIVLTPVAGIAGFVNVEANLIAAQANLPWLQYNWSYTGTLGTTYSNDPLGRGTFGIYQGNNRVIYQKEVTQ